jgi:hypothetical protein
MRAPQRCSIPDEGIGDRPPMFSRERVKSRGRPALVENRRLAPAVSTLEDERGHAVTGGGGTPSQWTGECDGGRGETSPRRASYT